jgi:hypothetical protein
MGGEMVRYRSRKVEVDGAVYQVRAQSKEDGRVQVQIKVRGGGEAAGELVAPADHLVALGKRSARWPEHSAGGPGRWRTPGTSTGRLHPLD